MKSIICSLPRRLADRRVVTAVAVLLFGLLPARSRANTVVTLTAVAPETVKYIPDPQTLVDNTTYDARGWTSNSFFWIDVGNKNALAVELGDHDNHSATGQKNITWRGGIIKGKDSAPDVNWTWKTTHDDFSGAALCIHNNTTLEIHHLRVDNVEDGVKMREAPYYNNTGTWLLRDSYFTAIRDDSIDNDRFESGTVRDCLFDGVHTFYSEQLEGNHGPTGNQVAIGPNENHNVFVTRVLVRLHPTNDLGTEGPGKWFKLQGDKSANAPNHNIVIEDSVFAIDATPRLGWNSLDFNIDRTIDNKMTWTGSENYILWLGNTDADYQGPRPGEQGIPNSGANKVTYLFGDAAWTKWREKRNNWLITHGLPSLGESNAKDPFTSAIVELDSTPPNAPANLSAIAGNGQVSLDWANNTAPDLAGYNVYRSLNSGGPWSNPRNGSLLTVSNYTDNNATNGTTYFYVVTAVDYAANESPDSAPVSAKPSAGGSPSVYDANVLAGLVSCTSSNDPRDAVSNASASGGDFLRYRGNAQGDWIQFAVNVPVNGTYEVKVKYAKIPYGGKVQLAIDTAPQGTQTDTYASSANTGLASFTLGTPVLLQAGDREFRFTATGKNAASSGYYIAIDTITLTPQ